MTASLPRRLEPALCAVESAASAGLWSLGERHRLGQIGTDEYRSLRHRLLVTLRRDLAAPPAMEPEPPTEDADRVPVSEPPAHPKPRSRPLGAWAGWVAVLLGVCVAIAMSLRR